MLSLDSIIGQTAAVDLLRGLLRTGRVPHALLFHGPEGVGKATTAAGFAAALVCDTQGDRACGRCASCGLLERGSHPDFLRVGRLTRSEIEAKETSRLSTHEADASQADLGAQILVDQIRALNALVGLRPRQSHRRVLLIDPAERMNREAQNALLKTLEEPPERSTLVLASAQPHLLLGTVRSRCFSVGFSALGTAELAEALTRRGLPRDEAGARAALAEGSLGRALTLDLAERRERRREIFTMLETLSRGPSEELPAMGAALAGSDEPTFLDGLDLLQTLLRDVARAGVGPSKHLVHADLAQGLEAIAQRLGPQRAAGLVQSADRLRGDLRFHANRLLMAEALLAGVAGGPLP